MAMGAGQFEKCALVPSVIPFCRPGPASFDDRKAAGQGEMGLVREGCVGIPGGEAMPAVAPPWDPFSVPTPTLSADSVH